MRLAALAIAFGRLILWMLGFLALICLITWLSPEQSGAQTVPGWAEVVVWMMFVVPIFPAVSAGVAKLRERTKWSPLVLGAIFGLMTPFLGIASLATLFVLIGFDLDLGSPDDRVPDLMILAALLFVAMALGVTTALWRRNALLKQ